MCQDQEVPVETERGRREGRERRFHQLRVLWLTGSSGWLQSVHFTFHLRERLGPSVGQAQGTDSPTVLGPNGAAA